MPWIAKMLGNDWDTYDTEWLGPFKTEDYAKREMKARFPKHVWVNVQRLVIPRKSKSTK